MTVLHDAGHKVRICAANTLPIKISPVLVDYTPWCSSAGVNHCRTLHIGLNNKRVLFMFCFFVFFPQISSAVDTLTGGLFCKLDGNMTLPENKSRELEQNLRQIMESTFKVFFDLVGESVYFLYFDRQSTSAGREHVTAPGRLTNCHPTGCKAVFRSRYIHEAPVWVEPIYTQKKDTNKL